MADTQWIAKFPHPGEAPPKPSSAFGPDVYTYNDWVRAMRNHNLAKAVDALVLREKMTPLDAVETIALTVGVMCLDGTLDTTGGILGAFGRIL